MVNLRQTTK